MVDVADVMTKGDSTILALRTYGECTFSKGKAYRLLLCFVDFNLVKVLSTLVELDLQVTDPSGDLSSLPQFIQLCIDPLQFSHHSSVSKEMSAKYIKTENVINGLFRVLNSLGTMDATLPLILKPSQRDAARKVLLNRLSVIWGPPGIALSFLFHMYINLQHRHRKNSYPFSVNIASS